MGGSVDGVIFPLDMYRVFLEGDIMRGLFFLGLYIALFSFESQSLIGS